MFGLELLSYLKGIPTSFRFNAGLATSAGFTYYLLTKGHTLNDPYIWIIGLLSFSSAIVTTYIIQWTCEKGIHLKAKLDIKAKEITKKKIVIGGHEFDGYTFVDNNRIEGFTWMILRCNFAGGHTSGEFILSELYCKECQCIGSYRAKFGCTYVEVKCLQCGKKATTTSIPAAREEANARLHGHLRQSGDPCQLLQFKK